MLPCVFCIITSSFKLPPALSPLAPAPPPRYLRRLEESRPRRRWTENDDGLVTPTLAFVVDDEEEDDGEDMA